MGNSQSCCAYTSSRRHGGSSGSDKVSKKLKKSKSANGGAFLGSGSGGGVGGSGVDGLTVGGKDYYERAHGYRADPSGGADNGTGKNHMNSETDKLYANDLQCSNSIVIRQLLVLGIIKGPSCLSTNAIDIGLLKRDAPSVGNLQHISEREPDDWEEDPSLHPTTETMFMEKSKQAIHSNYSRIVLWHWD